MTTEMASIRYIIDDVPAAIAFYSDNLGFRLEVDASPGFASVVRAASSGVPQPTENTPAPVHCPTLDPEEHGLIISTSTEAPRWYARGTGPKTMFGKFRTPRRYWELIGTIHLAV